MRHMRVGSIEVWLQHGASGAVVTDREEREIHEAHVAGAGDPHGAGGLADAIDGPPPVVDERAFGVVPGCILRDAGGDGLLTRHLELRMFSEHLQHRASDPDRTDAGPQRAVEVHGGPASRVGAAPLHRRVPAHGVPQPRRGG